MIVLDTNVLSELIRAEPHSAVFSWVAAQPRTSLYTTSLNRAEILYGIALLPAGRRRDGLAAAADAVFNEELAGRVLPFESGCAIQYAGLVAARRAAGNPIEEFDALIAATALFAGASIATRDVAGFAGCGLMVIDPWHLE